MQDWDKHSARIEDLHSRADHMLVGWLLDHVLVVLVAGRTRVGIEVAQAHGLLACLAGRRRY